MSVIQETLRVFPKAGCIHQESRCLSSYLKHLDLARLGSLQRGAELGVAVGAGAPDVRDALAELVVGLA